MLISVCTIIKKKHNFKLVFKGGCSLSAVSVFEEYGKQSRVKMEVWFT